MDIQITPFINPRDEFGDTGDPIEEYWARVYDAVVEKFPNREIHYLSGDAGCEPVKAIMDMTDWEAPFYTETYTYDEARSETVSLSVRVGFRDEFKHAQVVLLDRSGYGTYGPDILFISEGW